MRKQLKRWQSQMHRNIWWRVGAIAAPISLLMMWGLWASPAGRLQLKAARLVHSEGTLTRPRRESLVSDLGILAAVTGGVFLLLNLRTTKKGTKTTDLSGTDFRNADLSGADFYDTDLSDVNFSNANLSGTNLRCADLSGADLNCADLSSADLSEANLKYTNLSGANLIGANLKRAELRYADLSGANLKYTNLSGANLRCANLSRTDLNCALIRDANLSDANLSGALLFFINSREALNLEPLQLKAKPSPFLCNVALPAYAQQPNVNPNRDCDRLPQLLSDRYGIPLEEAEEIVDEARQHQWE
ncbi:Pentapeptide repeat protein [Synechococcus sp. PCC 7335]|uniref:pentapeptide repeat-containing protein n=1 Tax=Synechococcus sp. (strain ATCC 29403 / PCC 7335) TaxID=91464 RepID=UPI00017EC3B2|nr:pentapeptide repeat-containing protein [Synechococcus sp. PCC 7335]EDX85018.1 Pentapeptide repeat protein [Synechococcus sp. PCC 7335]